MQSHYRFPTLGERAVARLAADRGAPGPEYTAGLERPLLGPSLSYGDTTTLQEVVWDLVVNLIVRPGVDVPDANWPALRMTERGRRAASEEFSRSV